MQYFSLFSSNYFSNRIINKIKCLSKTASKIIFRDNKNYIYFCLKQY